VRVPFHGLCIGTQLGYAHEQPVTLESHGKPHLDVSQGDYDDGQRISHHHSLACRSVFPDSRQRFAHLRPLGMNTSRASALVAFGRVASRLTPMSFSSNRFNTESARFRSASSMSSVSLSVS